MDDSEATILALHTEAARIAGVMAATALSNEMGRTGLDSRIEFVLQTVKGMDVLAMANADITNVFATIGEMMALSIAVNIRAKLAAKAREN